MRELKDLSQKHWKRVLWKKLLPICAMLLVSAFNRGVPSLAAPYPGTGAPISAIRTVTADGDPTNPFSYPFLSDIAKSLARNGFPASFFLSSEGGRSPGIDLRTILLYETGILKSPVRFFVPQKQAKQPDGFPSLSITTIPESDGTMPGTTPSKAEREKAAKQAEADGGPSLTFNSSKFTIDSNKKKTEKPEVTENVGDIALSQPITLSLQEERPKSHDADFHFWTVPQALSMPQLGLARSFQESSFVMMSPQGLKSVSGRKFNLEKGQLLASSMGQPISIDTPAASISVEPGSTAYIEIANPGSTRVRVMTKTGEKAVRVKLKSDGKEEVELNADEDLVVTNHSLTEIDKALQEKTASKSGGINWSKSTFSAKSLVDSDAFFSTDAKNQDSEQRQAMMWLRSQLK